MFDEMSWQKSEEYVGGELVGVDEDDELFKGTISFMIVGLRQSIPYVVKALPEKKLDGEWLKSELLNCLNILHKNEFNIRAVVCDNHASNVSAYRRLLTDCGQNDLFVILNGKKICLFYDTVHLIKNKRNNLLNNNKFLFPSFKFDNFFDKINVTCGEMRYRGNYYTKFTRKMRSLVQI